MSAFGDAYLDHLRQVLNDFLKEIDGIPADDLNTWKPLLTTQGGQETNTFAALGVHIVGSGEFMTLIAVGGEPGPADRPAARALEFNATATHEELAARYDAWLTKLTSLLAGISEDNLAAANTHPRYQDLGWTNARVLLHALDHAALHLGHAQIQRQLWDYERDSIS